MSRVKEILFSEEYDKVYSKRRQPKPMTKAGLLCISGLLLIVIGLELIDVISEHRSYWNLLNLAVLVVLFANGLRVQRKLRRNTK